jgi:broad specificity phosphatase PhoE
MGRVLLVRHGRASGGWDDDPDPGLDALGREQAERLADRLGPLGDTGAPALLTSPLRRCRETAAPLAARWGVAPVVEPAVEEMPSPPGVPFGDRVPWLRAAMTGTWSGLGPRYTSYRDRVVATVAALPDGAVVVSHFVAINAVIGACLDDDRLLLRSLDNASVTIVEASTTGLVLIESGHEADTLIR